MGRSRDSDPRGREPSGHDPSDRGGNLDQAQIRSEILPQQQ